MEKSKIELPDVSGSGSREGVVRVVRCRELRLRWSCIVLFQFLLLNSYFGNKMCTRISMSDRIPGSGEKFSPKLFPRRQ